MVNELRCRYHVFSELKRKVFWTISIGSFMFSTNLDKLSYYLLVLICLLNILNSSYILFIFSISRYSKPRSWTMKDLLGDHLIFILIRIVLNVNYFIFNEYLFYSLDMSARDVLFIILKFAARIIPIDYFFMIWCACCQNSGWEFGLLQCVH